MTPQQAEAELDRLVTRCSKDIELGERNFPDEGWSETARQLIIADYLFWSTKYEPYVDEAFWIECTELIRGGKPRPTIKITAKEGIQA